MSSSAWNNKTPLVSFSSNRASFAWSNVTQGNSITPDSKRKHLKPLKVGKSQFGPTLKKTRTKSLTLKIRLKPLGLVMKLSMGPKGQLISKCLFEKIVWTKIPTKNLIDSAHYTCWAESIKLFVGILVQTIFSYHSRNSFILYCL